MTIPDDAWRLPLEVRRQALEDRVRSNHEIVVARARALARRLDSAFDPLERVRRDPVGGVMAGVSAGVILASLGSPAPPRVEGNGRASGALAALPSIWSLLSSLAPVLLSALGRRRRN